MRLIDFQMLNQPYIPGINPTWSCFIVLFICYYVWFSGIWLKIFVVVVLGFASSMWPVYLSCVRCPHHHSNKNPRAEIEARLSSQPG